MCMCVCVCACVCLGTLNGGALHVSCGADMAAVDSPAPHKDLVELYERMSAEGGSVSEAHRFSAHGIQALPTQ